MGLQRATPSVLRIANALYHTGLTTPAALRVVADTWRTLDPDPLTRTQVIDASRRTLELLDERHLLRPAPEGTHGTVVNEWRPPLYNLYLNRLDVSTAELRQTQEHWNPEEY